MASTKSVCIRCGEFKSYAVETCPRCQLTPTSADEIAKSHVLSAAFDMGEESFGRLIPELELISTRIKAGEPFAFDPVEVESVKAEFEYAESIGPVAGAFAIAKWLFVPAVLGVLVVLSLIYD